MKVITVFLFLSLTNMAWPKTSFEDMVLIRKNNGYQMQGMSVDFNFSSETMALEEALNKETRVNEMIFCKGRYQIVKMGSRNVSFASDMLVCLGRTLSWKTQFPEEFKVTQQQVDAFYEEMMKKYVRGQLN